jgi:hypothetical protein
MYEQFSKFPALRTVGLNTKIRSFPWRFPFVAVGIPGAKQTHSKAARVTNGLYARLKSLSSCYLLLLAPSSSVFCPTHH